MKDRLCNTFKYISKYVWNLLSDSHYYGFYQTSPKHISIGLSLSEETISDMTLLKTSQRHPYDIISVKFGKTLESGEGTDWEWWVISSSGIIGLKLQAKRIHVKSNNYEYTFLDYKPKNSKKYQAEILVEQAQKKRMIPLYIFFNWWDLNYPFRNYINRNIPQCCKVYTSRSLGVTIASGWEIKRAVFNKQKSLSHILPLSYPIRCLACCQNSDLTESVFKFLQKITGKKIEEKNYLHKQLPRELYLRLRGEFKDTSPIYTIFLLDLESPHDDMYKKYWR